MTRYIAKFNTNDEWENAGDLGYPNVSYVAENDTYHYDKVKPLKPYVSFTTSGTNKLQNTNTGNTFEYSYDKVNWSSMTTSTFYEFGQGSTSGDYLYVRGINAHTLSGSNSTFRFYDNGGTNNLVNVGGQVMALIDYRQQLDTIEYEYCFKLLFGGCIALQSVSDDFLPATTLVQGCYSDMFSGCKSLLNAPALPATTLVRSCYFEMFYGCTSLVNVPTLPATTLINNCYEKMFSGCTSLSSITSYATNISALSCLNNWLVGVASTGTLRVPSSMVNQYPSGANGIPNGWTYVNID